MRLAPPVLSCLIILTILIPIPLILLILPTHDPTPIRLKLVAWSQQTLIPQDIRLILLLLTTVMYPARHIISTYLLEIFEICLDILSLGTIRIPQ